MPNNKSNHVRNMVGQMIDARQETKNVSVTIENDPIDQAGETHLLNPIAVGAGETQRIGNTVTQRSLYLKMSATQVTTQTSNAVCRFIVYSKKNASGPDMGETLVTLPDEDAFTVYYDSGLITIGPDKPGWQKIFKKRWYNKRISGKKIHFNGTTDESHTTGPLYLYYLSSRTGNDAPSFYGSSKVWYKDG